MNDDPARAARLEAYRKWYAENPEKSKANVYAQRQKDPQKEKARRHEYYLRNRERILAACKKWRQNHPEQAKALSREWKQTHPEIIAAAKRKYYKSHREQLAAYNRAWRQKNAIHIRETRSQRYVRRIQKEIVVEAPAAPKERALDPMIRREQRRHDYYTKKRKLL